MLLEVLQISSTIISIISIGIAISRLLVSCVTSTLKEARKAIDESQKESLEK